MKYMGSKARHAKELLPIILRNRKDGQWYVEPFVGGANMIDKVDGNRIGADLNPYLINALKGIRDNAHLIPDLITEDDYKNYQSTKNSNDWLCGFVSFSMSFGGKFFGGYRRDKAGQKGCIDNMRNQTRMAKNSALKQQPLLQGVSFECCGYKDLEIPPRSIIYCDPPYENTTGYKDKFNHADFWQWCREKCKEGHEVFVSEYNAPSDFVCVWEKSTGVSVAKDGKHKKATEKLFVHESQVDTCNDIGIID